MYKSFCPNECTYRFTAAYYSSRKMFIAQHNTPNCPDKKIEATPITRNSPPKNDF